MTSTPIQLPSDFLQHTERIMGTERFARFLSAFNEEPPVSIRLNPKKTGSISPIGERVPWCSLGHYLPRRPNFTFDPLLHAGCYYVQEAASQFIAYCTEHVIRTQLSDINHVLDLCAAPGGKSTAMRSVLPEGCLLVSNEPVRQRAQVLSENIQKWGHADCVVTNNYPRDFARNGFGQLFDLVLCDVPCSGEGMFRKDPAAIGEWSRQGVERCQQLQRQIVEEIWPCLRSGGIMIYSTCTFNTLENEENILWLLERLGAGILAMPIREEWGITGSLLPELTAPVYRFIPGLTRSEGLFVCVLRKNGEDSQTLSAKKVAAKMKTALARMNILAPAAAEPLATTFDRMRYPVIDVPYTSAIAYLRREAITLPADTPRGQVVVSFMGHPLGFAKNIGTRANNLYPREWAIRSTHVPTEYEPII